MADSPPQFLSFNTKISPDISSFQRPSDEELEEMRKEDPPLANAWAIWEQMTASTDNKSGYSDSTHKVASFKTVKGFWTYWNHLPQPSTLLDGQKFVRETHAGKNVVDALMLFKENVKPEWEDPVNATGGHFQFQLRADVGGGVVDECWNNLILGMIGGTIQPTEMITGARLVDKLAQKSKRLDSASIRIEVWFADYAETEKVEALRQSLERCLLTKLDGTTAPAVLRIETKPHQAEKPHAKAKAKPAPESAEADPGKKK